MNLVEARKNITLIVSMKGNYYFKLNELSFNLLKSVKLSGLDWTIINELYSALKGEDARLFKAYILEFTPLSWDTDNSLFKKSKKAKWDSLNLILLKNNALQTFVKKAKGVTEIVPVLSETGEHQYNSDGDLLTEEVVIDKDKYDPKKKGASISKYADKALKEFDSSDIDNAELRARLVAFKIEAQRLALLMESI